VSNLSIIQIKILKLVNLTLDCGKINVDAFPSSEKQLKTLVKISDAWWGITFCNPQRWEFSETCWWKRMRGYEESKKNVFTYAWDFEFCNVCSLLCCGCCFGRSCRYFWLRVLRWWYLDDKKCRTIVFRWKIGSTYVPLMMVTEEDWLSLKIRAHVDQDK